MLTIAICALAAAVVLAAVIVRFPSDATRAQHLAVLANDKAALAWSMAPQGSWRSLLEHTTRLMAQQSGRPTASRVALEAAAAAALIHYGVKPSNARG